MVYKLAAEVLTNAKIAIFRDFTHLIAGNKGVYALQDALNAVGHTTEVISGDTYSEFQSVLTNSEALVIPPMSSSGFDPDDALDALLRDYVASGKTLISSNSRWNTNLSFLNEVFGFNLAGKQTKEITRLNDNFAVNTVFENGRSGLWAHDHEYDSGTWDIDVSSLPDDTLVIYEDSTGQSASLVVIPYGNGQIVLSAFDWHRGAPTGDRDGGWFEALEKMVSKTVASELSANDDDFSITDTEVLTGNLFADNGKGTDSSSVAGPLTVTEINGILIGAGTTLTLDSGALLTVSADGTFTYDPNDVFEHMPVGQADSDQFTYEVEDAGGNNTKAVVSISLTGIDNDDVFSGHGGRNLLYGGVGNDFINGFGGDDELYGEDGDDTIQAGNGNNILRGGRGNDTLSVYNTNAKYTNKLYGDAGDDKLLGDASIDHLFGGDGDDILRGFDGDDRLSGGADDDRLAGGDDNDFMSGDDGNDVLLGGAGDDQLRGGADNDILKAGSGNDILRGGLGDDRLFAGGWAGSPDKLHGDQGNDRITGSDFQDIIFGGADNDIIRGKDDDDLIYGEHGNDFIRGDGGDDQIDAGSGNDTVQGGDGDDVIQSASGLNKLLGNDGNDEIWGGTDKDLMRGGYGRDELYGNLGDDVLLGDADDDQLFGEAGDDLLRGGRGDDLMEGGIGDDRLLGERDYDTMFGDDGNDLLRGGEGDDLMYGGADNDTLLGERDYDSMFGGAGDDLLNGGTGNDTMTGGTGQDIFQFEKYGGRDIITDMVAGPGAGDKIQLLGFGAEFNTFARLMSVATQHGSDVVFDLGNGDSLTLENTNIADLVADDFLFY